MLEWMERAGIIGEPRHARVAERGAKGRPFMAQAAQQLRVFVSHSSLDDAFCHIIVMGPCATPGAWRSLASHSTRRRLTPLTAR